MKVFGRALWTVDDPSPDRVEDENKERFTRNIGFWFNITIRICIMYYIYIREHDVYHLHHKFLGGPRTHLKWFTNEEI